VIWLVLYLLAIPAGPVHRDLPQPDRHRHPPVQVAVLLSLRDQPGRRRPDLLLVLRAELRAVYLLIEWLTGTGIAVLADDACTYGVIAAGLWPQIAYCMILYLTGLNNVNRRTRSRRRGWTMQRAGGCSGM
jgi:hypothetical protein